MVNQARSYNITWRVEYHSGIIGALSGESQGRALERAISDLNSNGYRVVFVTQDQWNVFRRIAVLLLTMVSLGFWSRSPNLLIIGEPIGAATAQPAQRRSGAVANQPPQRQPSYQQPPPQ